MAHQSMDDDDGSVGGWEALEVLGEPEEYRGDAKHEHLGIGLGLGLGLGFGLGLRFGLGLG